MSVRVTPITLEEARAFVGVRPGEGHHRHNRAPKIARWAIGVDCDEFELGLVAVAIIGNPKGQGLQRRTTFEVLRVASIAPPPLNACSRLYSAAARSAFAMGFTRGVTYTRIDEPGTSLRAAGWWPTARVEGRAWNTGNKADRWLPGLYMPTTEIVDRVRWEIGPDAAPELADLANLGRRKARAA